MEIIWGRGLEEGKKDKKERETVEKVEGYR